MTDIVILPQKSDAIYRFLRRVLAKKREICYNKKKIARVGMK